MNERLKRFACMAALLSAAAGLDAAPPAAGMERLVATLSAPDPLERERAAKELATLGPDAAAAVPSLIATFAGGDPYVAGAAIVALGRIGSAAVGPLTQALGVPGEVRRDAAIALGRIGPPAAPAVPALAKCLADAGAEVRVNAAYALGAIGSGAAGALPALSESLSDSDEDVRRAARVALGQVDPAWRSRRPSPEEVIASIERLVPKLMSEHHVPGVSVAMVHDGRPAWSKQYGVSDAAKATPVTASTLFEAASMSKPVFAVIAMQLVDAGQLDLDHPLVEALNEPAIPDLPGRKRITARTALSHTTGMPNWRPGDEEREGPIPLLFEPGARFGYSGEGVFYLQRAVEQITGKPLDVLARESLFEPLGLERTSFSWNPPVEPLLATGHKEDGSVLTKSRYLHPNAAYTLYTTAGDYARILAEAMRAARGESKLLSQSSGQEMLRRQVRADARDPIERPGSAQGEAVFWGLGWSINSTPGGEIFHHSGANRTGFRCYSQFSPARRSGLVVMTNGLGGGELWTRLVAAVGDL